ncbi:aminoglycoside phosphotransferase family protein [Cohnella sp. REN36]|uniref:aminoglycoside phosphotransferase family protein n=1 Tax=Cohnella sp. REN36 TaxID=2887347 RepID=UPI001D157896|nr:aminoglycoside phosphotransferase family protein [Cohnella sp. REN36]MCC3377111.1 aminoglycoside phosphotransferase family protein [Cohnella sp. REN36]
MNALPETFVRTIKGVHGDVGAKWLDELPALLRECERRYELRLLPPFELSFNYVAPAVRADGLPCVLKLGVPADPERAREPAALRLFAGRGAVRVLDADDERGILLLERLLPGRTLHHVAPDEEAVRIAAGLLRRLRTLAPVGEAAAAFPTTADWARGLERLRARFGDGTGPLPERLVARAEAEFARLHAAPDGPLLLLHGDLHHGNILSGQREPWLAVDPKGVVGESAFGVVQFLLNNLPENDDEAAVRLIRRRIAQFAEELGLRASRIAAWTFAHMVLSAWWCIEDDTDGADGTIRLAALLENDLTTEEETQR